MPQARLSDVSGTIRESLIIMLMNNADFGVFGLAWQPWLQGT